MNRVTELRRGGEIVGMLGERKGRREGGWVREDSQRVSERVRGNAARRQESRMEGTGGSHVERSRER